MPLLALSPSARQVGPPQSRSATGHSRRHRTRAADPGKPDRCGRRRKHARTLLGGKQRAQEALKQWLLGRVLTARAVGVTRDPDPPADGQIPRSWAPATADKRAAGTAQSGGYSLAEVMAGLTGCDRQGRCWARLALCWAAALPGRPVGQFRH